MRGTMGRGRKVADANLELHKARSFPQAGSVLKN